ncbi:hypothetical protein [Streptomyces sp. Agncl-13]|uniref:hypothetical protein n=1 Tax=Streptomyces sp. Agncl-13 TaxID=3400628 RepID=UPI003A845329
MDHGVADGSAPRLRPLAAAVLTLGALPTPGAPGDPFRMLTRVLKLAKASRSA